MLTFVCWKWKPPTGYRTTFTAEHVRILGRMIARHYHKPHRFACVTDDPSGLDGIETLPLWKEWASIPNPSGGHNPSCYRRLKLFAPDAGDTFGPRVVSIDLDMVITADITPLFDRPEDFIIWGESDFPRKQWFNGSLWYLRTGTRPQVYTRFNPKSSPIEAYRHGGRGSDQAWISHVLGPPKGSAAPTEAVWGKADGIYSFRKDMYEKGRYELPADARVLVFHGKVKQDSPRALTVAPWIRTHYQ